MRGHLARNMAVERVTTLRGLAYDRQGACPGDTTQVSVLKGPLAKGLDP